MKSMRELNYVVDWAFPTGAISNPDGSHPLSHQVFITSTQPAYLGYRLTDRVRARAEVP